MTSLCVFASLAPGGTREGTGVVSQLTIFVTTQWSIPHYSYRPSHMLLDHPEEDRDTTPENISPTLSLALANL